MAVSVSPYDNAVLWGPIVVSIAIVVANLLAWALNEHSWAYRHLLHRVGVPRMLFISNRAEGVPKTARPQSYWGFDLVDPHHLVESPVLNTFGLLVLHACTFLYWVAFVFVDVLVEWYGIGCKPNWCYRRHGAYGEWATFLTNWSISILGISGLVAFCNTYRYAKRQHHYRKHHQQQQQQVQLTPQANSHTAAAAAPAATPAAEAALPATQVDGQGLPGPWVHVFHRATADAAGANPIGASARDQNSGGLRQQEKKQGGAGEQAPAGDDSSSSASSCCSSCDTVVAVGQEGSHTVGKPRTEKWDWLSILHCLLSEVATSAAWFVSFWYWVGIVGISGDFRANVGVFMAHAGNFVLASLQLMLTRLPVVSLHFQALLWYTTAYMIFLLAYGGGSGTWRYGLDVQKSYSAAALIVVLLIVFIWFCMWFGLACLREGLFRRRQHRKQRKHSSNVLHTHGAGREDADGDGGAVGGGDAAV